METNTSIRIIDVVIVNVWSILFLSLPLSLMATSDSSSTLWIQHSCSSLTIQSDESTTYHIYVREEYFSHLYSREKKWIASTNRFVVFVPLLMLLLPLYTYIWRSSRCFYSIDVHSRFFFLSFFIPRTTGMGIQI